MQPYLDPQLLQGPPPRSNGFVKACLPISMSSLPIVGSREVGKWRRRCGDDYAGTAEAMPSALFFFAW